MALTLKGALAAGTTLIGTDGAGTLKVAAYFTGVLVKLGDLTQKRDAVETTNSSSTAREFVPGDIIDNGTYEVEILTDTQVAIPWGLPEVMVLTYPLRGTAATNAKKTFSAFLIENGGSHPIMGNKGMITKCILQITGAVVNTAAT